MVKIKEPQLTKANFTKLLKDVSTTVLADIETMFASFVDDERYDNQLYDVFMSMFRYYEINDVDEDVFKQCMHDTYDEHKSYSSSFFETYMIGLLHGKLFRLPKRRSGN